MTDDSNALADELDARLANADAALAAAYPGDRGRRQPVHTVYVPADRYDSGTVRGWAEEAKRALAAHGRSATELAEALDLRPSVAVEVYERLRRKLDAEPIEDLRIDFEDGYGIRPDEDEDAAAVAAAQCSRGVDRGRDARAIPRNPGQELRGADPPPRACAPWQLFVRALVEAGGLTDGFVVTLPKVTSVDQVEAFVFALGEGGGGARLEPGTLQLRDPGRDTAGDPGRRRHGARSRAMIHAGGGPGHRPALRHLRLLRVARRRGRVPEPGASRRRPRQGGHAGGGRRYRRARLATAPPTCFPWATARQCARRGGCTPAWSADPSSAAIYQGWDMHPAQLPSRYVATYAFFREGLPRAAERLRAYVTDGQSGFLDEPATAAAMAGFLLRGLECGALDAAELDKLVGVDPDTLAALARRRPKA